MFKVWVSSRAHNSFYEHSNILKRPQVTFSQKKLFFQLLKFVCAVKIIKLYSSFKMNTSTEQDSTSSLRLQSSATCFSCQPCRPDLPFPLPGSWPQAGQAGGEVLWGCECLHSQDTSMDLSEHQRAPWETSQFMPHILKSWWAHPNLTLSSNTDDPVTILLYTSPVMYRIYIYEGFVLCKSPFSARHRKETQSPCYWKKHSFP